MRHLSRVLSGTALAAVVAFAMTGCEQNLTRPEPTPDASAPVVIDDEGSGEAGPPPADPSEITEPGTLLRLGDTAVLPHREGVVALTVISIAVGDTAQFRAEFDDSANVVPYYISIRVENISETDLSYEILPLLDAVTADGESTGVVLFGSMDECSNGSFPDGAGQGTVVEACTMGGAQEGVQAAGARYAESGTDYWDSPVVWLP